MPHMPDMVFPNNVLHLKHKNGPTLEFIALDALKRVSNGKINIELACAEAWRESRYSTCYIFFYCYHQFHSFLYMFFSFADKIIKSI